jgi:hypothetical protein
MILSNPAYSETKRKYGHQKNTLLQYLKSQEDIDWMFFTTLNANELTEKHLELAE